MPDQFFAGVDLGGTKILTLVVDASLREVGQDLRPTEAEGGPEAVVERILASLDAAAAGRDLAAIGISTPGPCDPERGIVTSPPNLPGWHDVPLAALIGERRQTRARIENDANCAALAEFALGAGRGSRHMVLVAVGTGIGGGLVLDGRLYRGASGAAGEIGHMQLVRGGPVCGCGRPGCLEAMASGSALARVAAGIIAREPDGLLARFSQDNDDGEPNAEALSRAADAGDRASIQAIEEGGRYLGAGLVNLVNLFNPEVIALTGGLRKLGQRYLGPALKVLAAEAFAQSFRDVRVVETELGDEAAALGAALIGRSLAADDSPLQGLV